MNMELNLSENLRKYILAFFLVVLPLIVLVIGLAINYINAWYYVLSITWFGTGLIFYSVIE